MKTMASEEDQDFQDDHSTRPTLPLFSGHSILPPSPEHPFMATPLYTTSSSIPFTWEEKPGKRRPPSTPPPFTLLPHSSNILEPPPGRVAICYHQNKAKKSPDTVLDGPYNIMNSSSSECISSSFRLFMHDESLDSGKKKVKTKRLLFPSWKLRTNKNVQNEIVGSSSRSFVFPSTIEADIKSDKSVQNSRISRSGSLRIPSPKPQFWASVYQGLKLAIPWTSRKSRKNVFV